MTCSVRQPLEGEEELGAVVADFEPGGGVSEGFGILVQGGDTGGVVVWGGDVGNNPKDGVGPEYFPTQGRAMAHREASK